MPGVLHRERDRATFPIVEDSPAARRAIGARIGAARAAAGYGANASAFARAIGVAPNTVYRWESGEIVPDVWRLESISRVCRVTMDYIVRGEAAPSATEALEAWRATPRGQTASPAALAFLRSVPLAGYVASPAFFDLLLLAYEQGLSPEEAATAARVTATLREPPEPRRIDEPDDPEDAS